MAHNIEYTDNYELNKCINFKDLLEIHGFHNICSEIWQNIERNLKNVKDFRTNIANKYCNLEFRIGLNWYFWDETPLTIWIREWNRWWRSLKTSSLETDKFWGFKVEILQIYHRNPRISQYTKRNLHKY